MLERSVDDLKKMNTLRKNVSDDKAFIKLLFNNVFSVGYLLQHDVADFCSLDTKKMEFIHAVFRIRCERNAARMMRTNMLINQCFKDRKRNPLTVKNYCTA